MLPRILAILGIFLALMGFMIAPGIMSRRTRSRPCAMHQIDPWDTDIPWDLTDWIPFGINDSTRRVVKKEWVWLPNFQRIK